METKCFQCIWGLDHVYLLSYSRFLALQKTVHQVVLLGQHQLWIFAIGFALFANPTDGWIEKIFTWCNKFFSKVNFSPSPKKVNSKVNTRTRTSNALSNVVFFDFVPQTIMSRLLVDSEQHSWAQQGGLGLLEKTAPIVANSNFRSRTKCYSPFAIHPTQL